MRIPETISPLRRKVITGLEQPSTWERASFGPPGLVADRLASRDVNAGSADFVAGGASGTNDSDMACNWGNYRVAPLRLSKTVTRRLTSLAISTLGIGTVAPKPATFLI